MAIENEIFEWKECADALVKTANACREEPKYTDCKMYVGGEFGTPKVIMAHILILTNASLFFKKMFNQTVSRKTVISLAWISAEDMELILHFIYNGKVEIPQSQLSSFLQYAAKFELKGLEEETSVINKDKVLVRKRSTPEDYVPAAKHARIDATSYDPPETAAIIACEYDSSAMEMLNNNQRQNSCDSQVVPELPAAAIVDDHEGVTLSEKDDPTVHDQANDNLPSDADVILSEDDVPTSQEESMDDSLPSSAGITISDEDDVSLVHEDDPMVHEESNVDNLPTGAEKKVTIRVVEISRKYSWYKDINFEGGERKTCDICSETFRDNYELDMHKDELHNVSTEESEMPCNLFCPECKIRLAKYADFKQHMDLIHPFSKHSFPERLCNYTCPECKMRLTKLSDFKLHMDSIHPFSNHKTPPEVAKKKKYTKTIFKCKFCNKEFNKNSNYKRHLTQIHKVGAESENKPSQIISITNESGDEARDPLSIQEGESNMTEDLDFPPLCKLSPLMIAARPNMNPIGEPISGEPVPSTSSKSPQTTESVQNPNFHNYRATSIKVLKPVSKSFKCCCIYCEHDFSSIYHLNRHLGAHESVLSHGQRIGFTADKTILFWCGRCRKADANYHAKNCGKWGK